MDQTVHSDWYNIDAGVPQGSALAPLLYLVYVNDIFDCQQNCTILALADDIALYTNRTGRCLNKYMPHTLNKITFNQNKLQCMLVTKCKANINLPPLTLQQFQLPFTNHCKYRSVTFQSDGKYKKHNELLLQSMKHVSK